MFQSDIQVALITHTKAIFINLQNKIFIMYFVLPLKKKNPKKLLLTKMTF